jgi:hypothetical protein
MGHPEAEQALASGSPLKELVPMFSSRAEAYEYFAQHMTQRFASADAHCAHCGQPTEAKPFSFVWRANVHTARTVLLSFVFTTIALLGRTVVSHCIELQFATVHRLCPGCRRRHTLQRALAGLLYYIFFALLIVALLFTVPAVVMLFVAIFNDHGLIWGTLACTLTGLLVLGTLAAGFDWLRRWPIPRAARVVGQFPFALREVV